MSYEGEEAGVSMGVGTMVPVCYSVDDIYSNNCQIELLSLKAFNTNFDCQLPITEK